MIARTVSLCVNGRPYERAVEPRMTLADFLRHELRLTGTHIGCEHGVCGACTVLVDGVSARSCLMLAVQADGAEITTVEGLASSAFPNLEPGKAPDELNLLQEAFRDNHGLQCGYCTPGMLIVLTELLRENDDPSEWDVRDAISGNLCRCTGYHGIVRSALDAASRLRAAKNGAGSDAVPRSAVAIPTPSGR